MRMYVRANTATGGVAEARLSEVNLEDVFLHALRDAGAAHG